MSRAVSLSTDPVGSSASTTLGECANARAIATRCRCPPERKSGFLPHCSPTPRFRAKAFAAPVLPPIPFARRESIILPPAERNGSSPPVCKIYPRWLRRIAASVASVLVAGEIRAPLANSTSNATASVGGLTSPSMSSACFAASALADKCGNSAACEFELWNIERKGCAALLQSLFDPVQPINHSVLHRVRLPKLTRTCALMAARHQGREEITLTDAHPSCVAGGVTLGVILSEPCPATVARNLNTVCSHLNGPDALTDAISKNLLACEARTSRDNSNSGVGGQFCLCC